MGCDETGRWATDRETLERESAVEFVKASGPGGQHRNKRETGVRLVHEPSGVTVMATERRSQALNRETAFERLIDRLEQRNAVLDTPDRKPTKVPRAVIERRLDEKRRTASRKVLRRPADGLHDD